MGAIIGLGVLVVIAIILLKGFDIVAGRGPKQVSDGIMQAISHAPDNVQDEHRVACPFCAERILPEAKKCPFCKTDLPAG